MNTENETKAGITISLSDQQRSNIERLKHIIVQDGMDISVIPFNEMREKSLKFWKQRTKILAAKKEKTYVPQAVHIKKNRKTPESQQITTIIYDDIIKGEE